MNILGGEVVVGKLKSNQFTKNINGRQLVGRLLEDTELLVFARRVCALD